MGFVKSINNYFYNQKINKRIKSYKYVHIMFNDKFNKPFVDFLNRNFDKKEHLVLCKRFFKEYPFPTGENVIEIKSLQNLNFKKCEKIICHSLFDGELVDYLYKHKDILKEKSYWMIWGGDLYNAPRDKKNDFVRSNLKGYLTDFDKDVVQNKYKLANRNFYCIHAVFPITKEMLNNAFKIAKDFIRVQINNSCDSSTLDMLDVLSKFKNENIKITTILSYGKMEYKDEIIKKGKEIFNDKFEYVENDMSPNEYAQHLTQNDILILNQNRQQGVGNTIASLALGSKVFIRSDVSTNNKFKDFDIVVYDTKNIQNLSFEEFIKNDNYECNQKNVLKFFDNEYKASLWKAVFDAE